MSFAYRALTFCGSTFQNNSTRQQIGNSAKGLAPLLLAPTTPNWQRRQALPPARFGLFPFRSPLLRESLLLSSPRGTEMFQFPRFPLPVLCVQTGVTPLRVLGFPIRISTDQSLVGSSPWLFAATHVLHRCQVPRHPPLALCSLEEHTRCSCSLCSSQGARRRWSAQRSSIELDADDLAPSQRKRGTEPAPRSPVVGGEPATTTGTGDGPPVHQLGRCLIGPGRKTRPSRSTP